MKKLHVILVLMLVSTCAFAQTRNLKNADKAFKKEDLAKAVELIKLAEEEPENQAIPDFWFSKGKIYTAVASTQNPEYKGLEPNAVPIALEAFKKSLELDQVGKFKVLAPTEVPKLTNAAYDLGAKNYAEKNYAEATKAFEICVNICAMLEMDKTEEMYTNAISNTALCADLGKDKEKAKKYYLILTDMRADQPSAYTSLATIFKDEGNKAEALRYADSAVARFPDNYTAQINAAGIHLMLESSERAQQILSQLTTTNADNPLVFFALGLAYDQMKMPEKTEEAYMKAVELKSDYFDAIFNLGAFYVNKGIEITTEANSLPLSETKKYDELTAKSKEIFGKAIPMLEKALEMKPNDLAVMTVLKDLYVQSGLPEKAKEMTEAIDKLQMGQ